MKLKLWHWIVIIIIAIPLIACATLAFLPVTSDPVIENPIVGAQPKPEEDDLEGIETAFPPIETPADNPNSPEKIALGYNLFFDPVLSAGNEMSCATCHHPNLGLSDNNVVAAGMNDVPLDRNTLALHEVAYRSSLFWDGRDPDLETQALTPLLNEQEMGADPDALVAELAEIPAYQEMFSAAFPNESEPVTLDNIARALASYERTLTGHNSPFDRYLAGDDTALTPSQRRGFALFRSGALGCYNCHISPLFTNDEFAVIGVPDEGNQLTDPGRGGVTGAESDMHAFRVPTLRNVALTAPYMHNGSFATLEEVVDFYAGGGGTGLGLDVPNQSRFIGPFELSAQEKDDLLNFLYSLTDQSSLPAIPAEVPSGLAVVEATTNPAQAKIDAANTGNPAAVKRAGGPTTLTVTPDVSIQSVVDVAQDGDTIEIEYGTYNESVVIDQNDITVRGIPNANGDWPILDGEMNFNNGIFASGDNFEVSNLAVKNYNGNGIIMDGSTGIYVHDVYVENTSLYGIYPVHATDILVERVEATDIRDAGIYAGQSTDMVIRDNVVYGNVLGIEIENSINSEVYNNHAYNNTTGIFVDLLPKLASKVSLDTKVYDNLVESNNLDNFALPGESAALAPPGTGILVLGGDDVEIYNNVIKDNRTVGIAIFSSKVGFDEVDMPPNPERVHIYDNEYENNGYDVSGTVLVDLGVPGADIIWDASNWDNKFDDSNATSFPPVLPSSSWPDPLRRAYWQILNYAINNIL